MLHEAADEGRTSGLNAARFPKVAALARRAPVSVVFSDPGIMTIGARHADVEPESIVTGEVSFEDQGAAGSCCAIAD
jgi:dihydrolipoamide dehydrogenase